MAENWYPNLMYHIFNNLLTLLNLTHFQQWNPMRLRLSQNNFFHDKTFTHNWYYFEQSHSIHVLTKKANDNENSPTQTNHVAEKVTAKSGIDHGISFYLHWWCFEYCSCAKQYVTTEILFWLILRFISILTDMKKIIIIHFFPYRPIPDKFFSIQVNHSVKLNQHLFGPINNKTSLTNLLPYLITKKKVTWPSLSLIKQHFYRGRKDSQLHCREIQSTIVIRQRGLTNFLREIMHFRLFNMISFN